MIYIYSSHSRMRITLTYFMTVVIRSSRRRPTCLTLTVKIRCTRLQTDLFYTIETGLRTGKIIYMILFGRMLYTKHWYNFKSRIMSHHFSLHLRFRVQTVTMCTDYKYFGRKCCIFNAFNCVSCCVHMNTIHPVVHVINIG